MGRMVAVDKEQNSVFSVRSWYGMMGARGLTMIRRGGYKTLQHCHNRRPETSSENSLECKVELVRGRCHRVEMVTKS